MIRNILACSTVLLILASAGCVSKRTTSTPSSTRITSTAEDDMFDPDRPPTAQTLYFMADLLAKQGRTTQAEQTFRRIIKEYPNFLVAYNDLAALLMSQRRIPEAMATLQMGLSINEKDPVLLNNMGMCWLVRKQYDKALEAFTEAAGIIPENTRYRSNMATALVLLGRDQEALAIYRQILPEDQARQNVSILQENLKATE